MSYHCSFETVIICRCYEESVASSSMTMAMNESYFDHPINMDRVCRVCLVEGTNLSPIFCTDQDDGLSQKIQVCGSIEIHENDGLPSLICNVCICNASVAHEFRQQCQRSDTQLRLIYDKPVSSTIVVSINFLLTIPLQILKVKQR